MTEFFLLGYNEHVIVLFIGLGLRLYISMQLLSKLLLVELTK